jgi:hypothetical protein
MVTTDELLTGKAYMNKQPLRALGAGLILGTAMCTAALGATLDVKTGLWEVSSSGETTGMPPIPPEALAQMPPEQRAQMQARMAAAMARSNKPDVSRSCITEKTLQHGLNFNEQDRANCKRTTVSSSSSQIDVRMECTGEQKMNGTFHFEAIDRQTMRGKIDLVVSNGANTMTMKRTMQGKWLGSDCGNVKPQGED